MNRLIKLPVGNSHMRINWDNSLFTAIVPRTEESSLLIYAGNQFEIGISAEEFSKIIDDTNSEISRVNEIDAIFSTMSLLGESFSYINFEGVMSGIFRLSWDTSVHFSGAKVTRNMRFTTELHFSVVQVKNDTVNTMVRSYTIDHTKNLSSGSKRDVAERMWELLYQNMWEAHLNSLSKRKECDEVYRPYNRVIARIFSERESVWLPIDVDDIVRNIVEGLVLNLAVQKAVGKISLENEVTLEDIRHDNQKKLEQFKLEAAQKAAEKEKERQKLERDAYTERERAIGRAQSEAILASIASKKGK